MWRLRRIIVQNLCAFRELDYHLSQGVTTLVFGDNRDNESQRSNGSGKSALLEAIAVGITGSPMRKVKNEEIIRDDAGECWVCLTFDNDASDEVFTVERQLSRKGASIVSCHIERAGRAVETDEAVQPSVDSYNRYILEKLGITREELYNNFLLSKYKYSDFLSSSDKEKKEIINRFSHANLVDQAIEKLVEDYTPVGEEVRNAELELAGIDGRINMLQEQIEAEEKNCTERARRKEEQICDLEKRIAIRRSTIRECREEIAAGRPFYEKLAIADAAMQQLENGESGLEECLAYITCDVVPLLSGKLTDWGKVLDEKKKQIHDAEKSLQDCECEFELAVKAIEREQEEYNELSQKYQTFEIECHDRQMAYDRKLKQIEEELTQAGNRLREVRQQRLQMATAVDNLKNKLAGSITCPACGHEFLVAEKGFDMENGRKQLISSEKEMDRLLTEITQHDCLLGKIEVLEESVHKEKRGLNNEMREWSRRLSLAEDHLETIRRKQEEINRERGHIMSLLVSLQGETDSMRRRLFDEVFGLLDETYRKQERETEVLEEKIKTAENAIKTLEDTIGELRTASMEEVSEGLKKSLKAYRNKANEVLGVKTETEKRLRVYQEQEQRFIQFKTYLANSKIEALGQVTNEFLANIGSDIRIRFAGYTMLKTGKVREKISIYLLRDGVDCGSYGKFSAGEAARVNLATILAMQKLVNGNCTGDKGLDLLVLDEILEAVDEEGLSSMFSALNKLGITALVVSHGNVAEGYPHKLLITKENGESKIE
mgnify:CR=1 FL=1